MRINYQKINVKNFNASSDLICLSTLDFFFSFKLFFIEVIIYNTPNELIKLYIFPQGIIMNSDLHDTSFYSQSKQNSSTVKELYEKFESLKHRIVNSDAKKVNKSIDKRSMFQNKRRAVNIKPIQLESQKYSRKFQQQRNDKISHKNICSQSSLIDLIENNVFTFILQNMQKLQQNMKTKITTLQKKLLTSSNQIRNLKNSLRKKEVHEKINFQKMDKLNRSCEAQVKQKSILSFKSPSQNLINLRQVSQISKKYQKQIKSIIENYQNKISLLISEGSQKQKNTKASSCDKKSHNSQDDLLKQCKSFQEKLLLKEQELNQLKIDSNRLKRMLDQSSKNYESISQLNRLLKQQNKQLEENIKKLETYKKNWINEKKEMEIQIQKLKSHEKRQVKVWKQEIKRLNLEIKVLKQSKIIVESKIKEEMKQQNEFDLKVDLQKIQNDSNVLDELDTVKSESSNSVHREEQVYQNLLIDLQAIHNQRKKSHSLIFNIKKSPRQQKQTVQQLKGLQAEINLLSEQNRLLKMKKDKFQQQIKNSQQDQERFQQQSQILKSQIKRLNIFVRKLQDCGIILLKKQQLTIDKINELKQESRLKELFYKTKVKIDTNRRGNSCRK